MADAAPPATAGGGDAEAGAGPGGDPAQAGGAARGVGGGVPGNVSATNELLRTAQASMGAYAFNRGTVAGRDITVHYHGADRPAPELLRPLGVDSADAVRSAFVPPSDFDGLVASVTGHHVVLLRATPREGADTAGLRLLLELGAGPMYRLDPHRPVGDLVGEQLEQAGGYLLSALSDAAVRSLNCLDLDGLEARLRPLGARLVVIVPTGATLTDQGLRGYVRTLGAPPAAADLLTAHLRWRLRAVAAADELLGRAEVAAAVRDFLEGEPSCRDVADLARLLSESQRSAAGLDVARVLEAMRLRAAENFDAWFDRLDDLPLRCTAIALALFNGLPFEIVTAAAARLRVRLEEPMFGRTTDPGIRLVSPLAQRPDPFRETRAVRLRRLRARITHTTLPAWFGDTPAQVMSYDDADYAPAVINRVWDEYDDVRPALVAWFGELGAEPSEQVRVWVATAVGLLATRAFEYILHAVIRPWAASGSKLQRETAAIALGVPATVGGLTEQVRRVVREWSAPEDGNEASALRAAAARVYGAGLGPSQPRQALAGLEYLADSPDNDVANAVGQSLAELIDRNDELVTPVLTAIVRWLGDRRHPERITNGHIAFLRAAIDVTHRAEPIGEDDDTLRWPLLLYLAETRPRLGPTIAGLWHATLNGPIHEDAQEALSGWAAIVEPDRRSCEAFGRLAGEIAADARTQKILLRLAQDWTTGRNPEPTPRAAASVITALSERSGES
ncbi:hypothetical protein ABT297_34525 [Dactylosporangium sp. NPDC000555]|uniref:hypothetical protein n=1 Tax=Dactylosporangium sp. NPDC000555 TaxID=3154260 RepID=UPI003329E564